MNILATPFNLFGMDGLMIFLIMLLLFGAKKLPELARGLGQAVREFSKAKDEFEQEVTRPPVAPQQLHEPKVEHVAEQPATKAEVVVEKTEHHEHVA